MTAAAIIFVLSFSSAVYFMAYVLGGKATKLRKPDDEAGAPTADRVAHEASAGNPNAC
jgi:hypothetical protein